MKKIAVCFVLFSLLISCGNDWADTVITNETGYEIQFKFNHTGEYTLNAGGTNTITFKTKAHQYLEHYNQKKRVRFEYSSTNDGYTGNFVELDKWPLIVENSIDKTAKLEADGWMDEIDNITAKTDNGNGEATGTIFTKNPVFAAEAGGYPVKTTSYLFIDDADDDKEKIKVLIHL
jgi:hypothetical protein